MRFYLCYFVILILQACSNKQNTHLENEEYEIINLVLNHRHNLAPDSVERKYAKQRAEDKYFGRKNYTKEYNEDLKKIDSMQLCLFIDDTLQIVDTKNHFIKNQKDSVYYPLVVKLADSTQKKKIDITKLKCKYNYRIDYKSNEENYEEGFIHVKTFYFSRVVFNKSRDRACIYFITRGGSSLFFFKKENGKWMLEFDKIKYITMLEE
ncbi:hypothetical protein AD998_05410 [bacterium 336/3]|nr:hypothetical protein AD998_05410 [bacterium 336/3]